MKKRILATLLALAMSLSVTSAFASETAGTDGTLSNAPGVNTPDVNGPSEGTDTDISVDLPTATVTELDVDALAEDGLVDLTYALRFEADEATEEQLDAYGDWYADFVLTLNKDATFSADDETADGYLAGFYSSWSDNWVKVPPADFNTYEPRSITVEAGEEIRIMETAAEMMGEPGLKYTYAEVYEVVNVFDCGAYFTPEFLEANPDLEITLELRVYNNEDESVNYTIGESYTFKRKAAITNENVVIQGTTSTSSNTVEIEMFDTTGITSGTQSVTIDTNQFVEASEVVDTVTIPSSAVNDMLTNPSIGENAELNITLAGGENEDVTVSINKDALEAIAADLAAESYTGSLTLKVEETEDLTPSQNSAVSGLNNDVVYKIVLETEDGDEIYTTPNATDNRKIVINLYYEKSNTAGDVVVRHLKDDGTFEYVPFNYANNIITITLSHFSEYVVYQNAIAQGNINNGGGGSVTQYTVRFDTDGGSTVESQKISRNNKVTKPTAPTKEGFTFEGWYTDKNFTTLYDFEKAVTKGFTLYAKWTEETKTDEPKDDADIWFSDVAEADWYYADVKYVSDNKLMNGVADTTFAPNALLTRAMLVTILYRNEGEPAVNRSIPFADVDMGEYYANAVIWAQQNGIVNGISETEFAPNNNITREQIATIIFRYAQYKGMDAVTLEENLHFTDSNEISEYAVSAMNWAVGTGLLKGKSDSTLNPLDNATRAEIAAILHRFIEDNK